MSEYQIALWTFIVTIIGVVAALGGLFAAWVTIRANTETVRAQFWLTLRELFAQFDDIHFNFLPGGKWGAFNKGPENASDKRRVERYMDALGFCDRLLEDGLVDQNDFARYYRYRLENLVRNPRVFQKLSDDRESWLALINLCHRLELDVGDIPQLTAAEHSRLYKD